MAAMCGRINVSDHEGVQALMDMLGMPIWPQYEPNWNVSPTALLSALVDPSPTPTTTNTTATATPFTASTLRWGIAAPWTEAGASPRPLINARSETLFTKATFKHLAQNHRTVIPVNGFYEWERIGEQRLPWFVQARDFPAMLFAAVYQPMPATEAQSRPKKAAAGPSPQMGFAFDAEAAEPRTDDDTASDAPGNATTFFGEFAVVTTESVGAMADIHHRSPVMLTPDTAARWLQGDDQADLEAMLQPDAVAAVTLRRVSKAVNSSRNTGPECIAAAEDD